MPKPGRDNPDSDDALTGGTERADEQAARWWLRRSEGLLDDPRSAEAQGFRTWLDAHPDHAAAWDAMLSTSNALDELPPDQAWAMRAMARAATAGGNSLAAAQPAATPHGFPTGATRRAVVVHAALVAVVALVGGGSWWAIDNHLGQPTYAQAFRTGRGQLVEVPLPDGSRLELDTATAVQVRLYRGRREVQLLQGQAMFSVAADAARPFTVDAARTRVTAVGTRFEVRHVGAGVGVQVEEGKVRVERRGADGAVVPSSHTEGSSRLLLAGDAVDADAQGRFSAVKAVSVTAVAPWRSGRLNFDDTPLAEALAAFARYGDTGLSVRDPHVAALRVTGSYDIAKARDFAQALPRVLPVRLQVRGTQTEVVAR